MSTGARQTVEAERALWAAGKPMEIGRDDPLRRVDLGSRASPGETPGALHRRLTTGKERDSAPTRSLTEAERSPQEETTSGGSRVHAIPHSLLTHL